MRESARAELRALGALAGVCLLRRSGDALRPSPLPPDREPPTDRSLDIPPGLGGRGPALVLDDAAGLEPVRAATGPEAHLAILCPVPPPAPSGICDLYLMAWFREAEALPPRDELVAAVAAVAASVPRLLREAGGAGAGGRLERAMGTSSQGIILCRRDGAVLWSNRSGERCVGAGRPLGPGDSLFDAVTEGARIRLRSLMETARAGAWAAEEIEFGSEVLEHRLHHVLVDVATWDDEPAFILALRPLTERDRLVDLLRREKDFTRSLLEAANACVLGLDLQGRTILFNRVFQEVVDYRLADVLGRDAVEILVPEKDRADWRESHLKALEGEVVTDLDFTVRTRDGQTRTLCLSAGRINDANGTARGVLWTGRDVSVERTRERDLRRREESTSRSLSQLKEFSRISSIILQEKSLDNVCRMFVEALSKVSTFRRAILTLCDADFRGYQWYFAGLSEAEQETFHRNKMTQREQVTIFQERFRLGNSYYIPHTEGWDYTGVRSQAQVAEMGDWHPDDFLFIPLYGTNRKLVGVVSVDDPQDGLRPTAESISPLELFANQVAHSIEERKLDQEVRQSTERYRTLVETMHEGVFSVDLRERILMANESVSRLLGVPEMLLNGRPLGSVMESEDLARFRAETALHDGGRVARFELCLRSDSGESIPVQVSASPYVEDDEHRGCFAVVRDLRSEKKAEEDRRAMQDQLVRAEKLSALGEMISGVAHELNNPLTGVMGYAEFLLGKEGDPASRPSLERIHKEAVRCQKIVQRFLNFSRNRSSARGPVNVNELVESTLELLKAKLERGNVTVVRDLAGDIPPICANFHELQQVLFNLVNNALQAMEEQGGDGRLTARTRSRGRHVEIHCTDSGPGIPPDRIKRIFDPFFTTKEIGKGTGLGLSLSYKLVKENDGQIRVDSSPGEGATFILRFPVPESMPEEIPAEVDGVEDEGPVESKEILVVDDEETIVDLLESVLLQAGHRVTTASNGREALEKIRQADYDVIISDVKMPDMGGQKLYECLSEIKPYLKSRVIFSTGDTVNPTTQALFQRTGNLHIAKPFRLEEVDQIIRQVLELHGEGGGGRPAG